MAERGEERGEEWADEHAIRAVEARAATPRGGRQRVSRTRWTRLDPVIGEYGAHPEEGLLSICPGKP